VVGLSGCVSAGLGADVALVVSRGNGDAGALLVAIEVISTWHCHISSKLDGFVVVAIGEPGLGERQGTIHRRVVWPPLAGGRILVVIGGMTPMHRHG